MPPNRLYFEVFTCCLVRNVTVCYTRWWHGVIGATYIAVHLSAPLTMLSRRKGKGVERWRKINHSLGSIPIMRWKKERWREASQAKKAAESFSIESADIGSYLTDISLDIEESTTEGLVPTKKKKAKSKRKMVYKYPRA